MESTALPQQAVYQGGFAMIHMGDYGDIPEVALSHQYSLITSLLLPIVVLSALLDQLEVSLRYSSILTLLQEAVPDLELCASLSKTSSYPARTGKMAIARQTVEYPGFIVTFRSLCDKFCPADLSMSTC
jgi:hypothetical protein